MSYGYDHPPAGDIDEIQELLRGYGSMESLVKEMVQNAEDALAGRLLFQITPANPQSPHPLLHGRGLCIINNGPFSPDDLGAMKRLRLGTKGANVRAIGRFGKGLKSVYAFCEAFFVAASVNQADGWASSSIPHFFNPRSGWRHGAWDDAFRTHQAEIFRHIAATVHESGFFGAHWVALWLPLRHPEHARDAKGEVGWIHPAQGALPAMDDALGQQIEAVLGGIAPSLVTLRNLTEVRFAETSTKSAAVWRLNDDSQRPVPIGSDSPTLMRGKLSFAIQGQKRCLTYLGLTGNLSLAQAEQIRCAEDWPMVQELDAEGNAKTIKSKGVPHFGAVLVSEPAKQGRLRVRSAVFLPISHQPGESEIPFQRLRRDITITLHGFAFLDGQRTRIDWLEDAFKPRNPPGSRACLEWNRFVMGDGALAHLPETVHAFVTAENFITEETAELIAALKATWTWKTFAAEICSRHSLVCRWLTRGEQWQLVPRGVIVAVLPPIADIAAVLRAFSGLSMLAASRFLAQAGPVNVEAGLTNCPHAPLSESDLAALLTGSNAEGLSPAAIAWLDGVLSDHWRSFGGRLSPVVAELIGDLPLIAVREGRTRKSIYVTPRNWNTDSTPRYYHDSDSEPWLAGLNRALPDFECWTVEAPAPAWVNVCSVKTLRVAEAAEQVLKAAKLAAADLRRTLAEKLAAHRAPRIRLAIRYLLHGCFEQIESEEWLQIHEPGSPLWAKLVRHVLADQPVWTVLDESWGGVFAGETATWLHLAPLTAHGAWDLLNHLEVIWTGVAFQPDAWLDNELDEVLIGLHEAAVNQPPEVRQRLLRRLPVHRLECEPSKKVSIAAADGSLDRRYVLHSPCFERELPEQLQGEWAAFLSDCALIKRQEEGKRRAVQLEIFEIEGETDERVVWELGWNYILRRCLESETPENRARLINHGLTRGDHHAKGLVPLIRSTAWLPLRDGGSIQPENVVYFQGLSAYLRTLGEYPRDGWTSESALADWLAESLKTHLPGFLFRRSRSFEILSEWAEQKTDWALGLGSDALPRGDRAEFLRQTEALSSLPAAKLLAELCRIPNNNPEGWNETVWTELGLGLCRPFGTDDKAQSRLVTIMTSLASNRHRTAFDAYLRQAARDGLDKTILPHLELVNREGAWMPAHRLIWPAEGVDLSVQLCDAQSKILNPADTQKGQAAAAGEAWRDPGHRLQAVPSFDKQADALINYLEPFADGQAGPLMVAALVAVLGPLPKLKSHCADLLSRGQSSLGYNAFFLDLLGDRRETLAWIERSQKRFIFEFVDGVSLACVSLTGKKFSARLSDRIDSLLVGASNDLARQRWVEYTSDGDSHLVRLRRMEDTESLENPTAVFAKTIDLILEWVQGRSTNDDCPPDIRAFLESLDQGQTDLRRSQSYLLLSAESRLAELGARRMAGLAGILQALEKARFIQAEADEKKVRSPSVAQKLAAEAESLRATANLKLGRILDGKSSEAKTASQALVNALKRKMTDFQYSPDSVLMELFQNADDAAVEQAEMYATSDHESRFSVKIDANAGLLEIVHWGRPINSSRAGFAPGEPRGYRQDLAKMLTLNFSDKGSDEERQTATTTGRFGLGFKSVFFIADEPVVLSDRIGFRIVAGFYPRGLTSEEIQQLKSAANSHAAKPKGNPTIFRLCWRPDQSAPVGTAAFEHFGRQAHLFTLFSRSIRHITLIDEKGHRNLRPDITPLAETKNIEVARFEQGPSYLVFRCELAGDTRPASLIFSIGPDGVLPLPPSLARIWVTTPLKEHTDAGWSLNAPFIPDPGRQRIALENPRNRDVASQMAAEWERQLDQLAALTAASWDSLGAELKVPRSLGAYGFWSSVWELLTKPDPVFKWEELASGGGLLSWLAWDSAHGAFRRVALKRPVVPAGLPSAYQELIHPGKLTHRLVDALAMSESPAWTVISQWPHFQAKHPPGTLACPAVTSRLTHVGLVNELAGLGLVEAVSEEIGEDGFVSPECAGRLGGLITACTGMAVGADSNRTTFLRLEDYLHETTFLARDGTRRKPGDLVVSASCDGVIEEEEIIRSAFAPDHARLSESYTEQGLVAFVRARKRLGADAQTLKDWVLKNEDNDTLAPVFSYLLQGDLRQELADQLRISWLDRTAKSSVAWTRLSAAETLEISRLFNSPTAGGASAMSILTRDEFLFDDEPLRQEIDAKEAMKRISAWWLEDGRAQARGYEERTYPANHPAGLPWWGTDEWSRQTHPSAGSDWLLLFADSSLVALGLNRIGRNRAFLEQLDQLEIADALVAEPIDPVKIVSSLDAYFHNAAQTLRAGGTFQFRQFLPIYGFGRFLSIYHETIRHLDRHGTKSGDFASLLSPNSVISLQGSGLRAADLGSSIGMGRCQLLRELYRRGRITNPAGHPYAYVPIRKVRRLFGQLFGVNPGKGIAASVEMSTKLTSLGETMNSDPTFGLCFDLPLQILAENPKLRDRVLKTSFEVEVDEAKEISYSISLQLSEPSQ
jgi:hypothetical protein